MRGTRLAGSDIFGTGCQFEDGHDDDQHDDDQHVEDVKMVPEVENKKRKRESSDVYIGDGAPIVKKMRLEETFD